jgi:hypothetical protein
MQLPVNYDNLTPKMRKNVRNEYIKRQNGVCWYCKDHLLDNPAPKIDFKPYNSKLFPPGFLNNPIHLHHDHKTGMTEGAVHAKCNAVLWQYERR